MKVWDSRPWSPERKVQYETRGYLAFHTPRFLSDDALQKAIQADQTINDQVRQQALDWSGLFWKDYSEPKTRQLNAQSWGIVKQSKLPAEKYQAALDMSLQANSMIPDNGAILNTLGVAQYRAQKYQEALTTLTRAAKLNAAQFGGDSPYDLVFLAMTHLRLNSPAKAADLLKRVTNIAGKAKTKDEELAGFIEKADTLMQSAPKEDP